MDIAFEPIPNADCYCDDICVATRDFPGHYRDLVDLLRTLQARNISIGPSKTFISFPNAVVLGRLVDSFGLSTTKERLIAISKLLFPTSLKDLETFLGMTGYMKSNVPRYAEVIQPLEDRKTAMLRKNPHKGSSKKRRACWASTVPIDTPTKSEKRSFNAVKAALTKHTILYFFSPNRILCIDFDVSRKGIGVSVYHIAEETIPKISKLKNSSDAPKDSPDTSNTGTTLTTYPPRTAIQPIAFLSCTLKPAEKEYWPTKMEVLGFVWALRKTRHWINVAQAGVYIFTDHRSIIGLTRHHNIVNSTALSNKNLRLVRAIEYISRFTYTVLHKPGRLHIIPDALSRLPVLSSDDNAAPEAEGDLEFLPDDTEEHWVFSAQEEESWAFPANILPTLRFATVYRHPKALPPSKGTAFVQISPEFRKKLQHGYETNPK
ncbi:hypothetical protein GQX73_g2213 [Xylaria multiplex]|uniref:Reverse transcriptase RNase H-like domain-containing protein n=1 Tax=Xylaria multiplex TaxID=323545 RepID=A0A7C8ISR9_9PEZI|nr:hypothetical protein GQX73_g2213 [Xylaria multiplex]